MTNKKNKAKYLVFLFIILINSNLGIDGLQHVIYNEDMCRITFEDLKYYNEFDEIDRKVAFIEKNRYLCEFLIRELNYSIDLDYVKQSEMLERNHDHELKDINRIRYGISNFFDLPEEPIIDKIWKRGNSEIPIYRLHKIIGTCIAKNKTKSSVSLLTPEGVTTVKFRNEYFSMFDKQISERGADGVKHIVEKSWFNRGSMIMVMGIRRGDEFIPKKYASVPGHQLYKIQEIHNGTTMMLAHERAQGEMIED